MDSDKYTPEQLSNEIEQWLRGRFDDLAHVRLSASRKYFHVPEIIYEFYAPFGSDIDDPKSLASRCSSIIVEYLASNKEATVVEICTCRKSNLFVGDIIFFNAWCIDVDEHEIVTISTSESSDLNEVKCRWCKGDGWIKGIALSNWKCEECDFWNKST